MRMQSGHKELRHAAIAAVIAGTAMLAAFVIAKATGCSPRQVTVICCAAWMVGLVLGAAGSI